MENKLKEYKIVTNISTYDTIKAEGVTLNDVSSLYQFYIKNEIVGSIPANTIWYILENDGR